MYFPKDTVMTWKHSGKPAYQKIDGEEWGNWRSLEYDLQEPLDKRWGWKWTDQQVYDWYKNMMYFQINNCPVS